jgi:dTDP-4-amino-4,6-dideoxygalactose transaminase
VPQPTQREAFVPIARPQLPDLQRVMARLRPSYDRGVLTNGPLVNELEERLAARLGTRHVVAVSSCTAGLMLSLRALELRGEAVLPSFTFSATAHAATWAGLGIRFSECQLATFQIDPADAERRLDGAAVLIATHVFGAPAPVEELQAVAARAGVPLVFDAAHAMGALHDGRPVGGFGDVEVFSLSPTKTLVAGEGGIVATDGDDIARAVRLGRDYGNPGDYDTQLVGLNARLSELHAALALESLAMLDENLARRRAIAERYRAGLAAVRGIAAQTVPSQDESAYKDFTVAVDAAGFGRTRDELARALIAVGCDTRPYFSPPVHRQTAYAHLPPVALPTTDMAAAQALSLPMFPGLAAADVDRVIAAVASFARQPFTPEVIP